MASCKGVLFIMLKSTFKKSVSVIITAALFMTVFISILPVSAASSYNVNYSAGNVDNIVGSSTFSLSVPVGSSFEFSDSSRFSRKGYKLSSWYITTTGETVGLSQSYIMPNHNLDVVANWKPETYSIGFAGLGGKTSSGESNIYISAECGTTMILPENPFTKEGYVFTGWKYSNVIYSEGESFIVPAVISGSRIVLSAVWKAEEAVTTPAVTTVTTTTTTTTTTSTTTSATTTTLAPNQVLKTLELGHNFTSNNETFKKYFYNIISREDTIDKLYFNFSADTESIGTVNLSFYTILSGSQAYQKDFQETIYGNKFTVDFGDTDTCNLIKYAQSIQVGCWYSSVYPLTLDSIAAVVREPEVTTTTSQSTTTTTTTTTTSTTARTTTTTTERTTATTTTARTTTTTLLTNIDPTVSSRVVYYNGTLIRSGSMLEINIENLINNDEVPESLEFTFRSENGQIGNHNIGMFMNMANGSVLYDNFTGNNSDSFFTVKVELTGDNQSYTNESSRLNLGYWWGDQESLIIESIKVNYKKEEALKGDLNKNGIIDNEDVSILKKLMVGFDIDNVQMTLDTCDINSDGSINVFDSILLQRSIK